MPPFPKPRFEYEWSYRTEVAALRKHKRLREIPERSATSLLVGTWNLANLGVQERSEPDYRLLAEVVSWFDIVALQEVNDNLAGFTALREHLPRSWRALVSEAAGNNERGAFLFDSERVQALEKVGRLSIPPSQLKQIKLPGSTQPFQGFDRGPYLAAFQAGDFRFLLVNVHLYYGSEAADDIERRALETYAVAWWARRRQGSDHAFTKDIVPLGDFNLPQMEPSDRIYQALTSKGLVLPPHSTVVGGTSLDGHNFYDQIAFFPGETAEYAQRIGAFDFDNAVFRGLWDTRTPQQFRTWLRYHLTDHRPLWAEFKASS